MTDRSPTDPIELARSAVAAAPAGLLADLDGTLAPIVADPAAARLAERGDTALRALSAQLAVTGIVTGRAARDARAIVGVEEMLVVGNHGLEWLEGGSHEPVPAPGLEWIAPALESLVANVRRALDDPNVTIEQKGLSATVHYRMAADPAAARQRIMAATDELPAGIERREGRMSIELRPMGVGDKGTAVHQVVERHALRGLIVLGDDVTDLDMFRAASDLRASGRATTAILAVGSAGEVPASVIAGADAVLADPAAVVTLLEALVRN
ncbi:MAG TPA: trehalose-phosphatase [Candidatus Limnocylindria bacterium]|nr:trehalose-phosphatase [Candidatus Limnocylindria bacterium]